MTRTDEAAELADDAPESGGWESFDAYRDRRARNREVVATTILGEDIELPESLPIGFELRMHRLSTLGDDDGKALEILHELVAMLYGDDAMEAWADDLDDEDLQTLLVWGAANVRKPYSMTFEQAADLVRNPKARTARKGLKGPTRSKRGSSRR